MGEVRFVWAEPESPRSQIQISALVQAMVEQDFAVIVRTVDRDNRAPKIGICHAATEGELHYLTWVQVPFKEDESVFDFPSLTKLVSKTGQRIHEHPLLPTDEQMQLMDQLVDGMDLDTLEEVGEHG